MAVSRRLRFEIFRRDDNTCRYCGSKAPDVSITVDHVTPKALGGSDKPENLVTACRDCNAGKSSASPDANLVADVEEKAVRWAAAQKWAWELYAERRTAIAAEVEEFCETWNGWRRDDELVPHDDDWEDSVAHWLKRGFTTEDLIGFIPKAMYSKVKFEAKWKYLCGIVWRTLDEIQADAFHLIETHEEPARSIVVPSTEREGVHVLFWLHSIAGSSMALPIRRVGAILADAWMDNAPAPITLEELGSYWTGGQGTLSIALGELRRQGYLYQDENNDIVLLDPSSMDEVPVDRIA